MTNPPVTSSGVGNPPHTIAAFFTAFFTPISRRFAAYGEGSARLVGVDVARGLAVLGMIGAHVLIVDAFEWDRSETWLDVVNGRSSILFAVLAGISVAIVTRRGVAEGGIDLVQARMRVAARAILIFAIGGILDAAATGFPIILATYAVLFVCAIPVLGWGPRRLIGAALGVMIIAPTLVYLARLLRDSSDGVFLSDGFSELMATGEFPAVFWVGFVFVGLAIGRARLASVRVQMTLLIAGVATSIVGIRLAEIATTLIESSQLDPGTQDLLWASSYFGAHSGSTTEGLASGGFAVAVIGACLLATRPRLIRWLLFPVAAVGSMALTAYVGHFVVIGLSGGWADYTTDPAVFGLFALGMMAMCTVIWTIAGRGPLEVLLTRVSTWAARLPPSRREFSRTATPPSADSESVSRP